MIRSTAAALAPALLLLVATCGSAPAQVVSGPAALVPVRQACDADGRCYETGDTGYRDDDAPSPRRFDPGDDDRPPPPPRRRYDPDDDQPPPPPRYRRYDPHDDAPPPPRRGYHRDDDE